MTQRWRIERLAATHDRSRFSSGSEPLDRYLAQQVTQDVRRRLTSAFVAIDIATAALAGYCTLAATSLPLLDLPDAMRRKLPRYPAVPAIRLGRLAVDHQWRGRGLGAALLADALASVLASDIAASAMVVDAIDTDAQAFWRHHGFSPLTDEPARLFLPLATARASLNRQAR